MGAHDFDADGLIDAAVTGAGLEDFGADGWREGLEVLLDGLGTEADLNELFVQSGLSSWASRGAACRLPPR